MNTSAKGARAEREVINHLRSEGYDHIIKSAGSKGVCDVIAFAPDHFLFIQVKTDKPIPHAEWNVLYEQALKVGAIPLLAERKIRQPVTYRRITGYHVFQSKNWPAMNWEPSLIVREELGEELEEVS